VTAQERQEGQGVKMEYQIAPDHTSTARIDRDSSAWLIKRFIDSKASFFFDSNPNVHPKAVPFDMYQAGGFGHEGEKCTFETLCARFGLADKKVRLIGQAIHDADLDDQKFGRTEGITINQILKGWAKQDIPDDELLRRGMDLVEGLYHPIIENGGNDDRTNVLSAAACLLACCCTFAQTKDDSTSTWKPVEAALGRPGQLQPGEVYKFALPRKDMKIVKDGVTVAPGLALGSWLAFKKMGSEAMVMGDLVLSEEEIEPVMLKLQQEKIEQSSIHNHLLGESPRVISCTSKDMAIRSCWPVRLLPPSL
jgi:hypothetical protein